MGYRLHMYDDYRCLTIKCIHILPSRRESYIGGLIMVPLPEDPPPGSFALFSASHLSASGSVRRVNSQEAIVSPVSGEHICSVADSPLVISLLCPTAPPPRHPTHTRGLCTHCLDHPIPDGQLGTTPPTLPDTGQKSPPHRTQGCAGRLPAAAVVCACVCVHTRPPGTQGQAAPLPWGLGCSDPADPGIQTLVFSPPQHDRNLKMFAGIWDFWASCFSFWKCLI